MKRGEVLTPSIRADLATWRKRESDCEAAIRSLKNQGSLYAEELRRVLSYLKQVLFTIERVAAREASERYEEHFRATRFTNSPAHNDFAGKRRRYSEQDEPDHWLADSGDDGQP